MSSKKLEHSISEDFRNNKLLKTNELVVDFRNHPISVEFLKNLAEELSNTPGAAMIGHVILGDIRPFKRSKYLQEIENTLIANNAKYRQFPSDYIHCLLAAHCRFDKSKLITDAAAAATYSTLEEKIEQKNWTVIMTNSQEGGYKSTLYENQSMKQLVLAFRGFHVEFKDYFKEHNQTKTAIYGILGKEITNETKYAYCDSLNAYKRSEEMNFSLSFTGYSLGAWLAEQSVLFCYNEFNKHLKAVTFESPGSFEILEQLTNQNITNTDTKTMHNLSNILDIKTYLLAPNFINTFNNHIGKIYRIFEPQKEQLIKDIDTFIQHKLISQINSEKLREHFLKTYLKHKETVNQTENSRLFYMNGLRSLFVDDLDFILQAFDHNTEMFKTKLVEAKRWPKINFVPKEDSFKGVIEEALHVIPLVGPNMQAFPMKEVASISLKLISPIIKQYLSGYLLIVNILAEILKGNFDDKQFRAFSANYYFDNDIKSKVDLNEPISILESNHNFDLKYIAHYELKNIDTHSDKLNTSHVMNIDSKLRELKKREDNEEKKDDLISRQFEMLKKLFDIEESEVDPFNYISVIKSNTVEIRLIRERFKRLLDIQTLCKSKVRCFTAEAEIESKQATIINAIIKSVKTQKYICASSENHSMTSSNGGGNNGKITALEEKFEIKRFDGNKKVGLLSCATNKYVCAPPNGTPLIANKETCDKWEYFEIVSLDNEKVAIKTCSSGKYVSVSGLSNVLLATASKIGSEEQFIIEEFEKITGKWIKVAPAQDQYFININGSNKWTEMQGGEVIDHFNFVKFDGDDLILQSQKSSNYVKLTNKSAFKSNTNNIEEAGKNFISNGNWNIKPEITSSINEGLANKWTNLNNGIFIRIENKKDSKKWIEYHNEELLHEFEFVSENADAVILFDSKRKIYLKLTNEDEMMSGVSQDIINSVVMKNGKWTIRNSTKITTTDEFENEINETTWVWICTDSLYEGEFFIHSSNNKKWFGFESSKLCDTFTMVKFNQLDWSLIIKSETRENFFFTLTTTSILFGNSLITPNAPVYRNGYWLVYPSHLLPPKCEEERIIAKWSETGPNGCSLIKKNSSNNWTLFNKNQDVIDNFNFVRFEGEDVILQSQSQFIYVLLTDSRALQSHTNNIEEASKYILANGMWNIKPSLINKDKTGVWILKKNDATKSTFIAHVPIISKWLEINDQGLFDTYSSIHIEMKNSITRTILKSDKRENFYVTLSNSEFRWGDCEEKADENFWRLGSWALKPDFQIFEFKVKPDEIKKKMRVRYNTVKDVYYISNEQDIKNWSSACYRYSNISYKNERDCQLCYLARTQGSRFSFIEWLFVFDESVETNLRKVDLRFEKTCFNSGKIDISLRLSRRATDLKPIVVILTDEEENQASMASNIYIQKSNKVWSIDFSKLKTPDLETLKIRAELSLGVGDTAWQQTQLFRQNLNDTEMCLFDIQFHFD